MAEAEALRKRTGDEGNGSSKEVMGKARIFLPSAHLPHGRTTAAMANTNHIILISVLSTLGLLEWRGELGSIPSVQSRFARPFSNPIHQKTRPFNLWALSILFLLSGPFVLAGSFHKRSKYKFVSNQDLNDINLLSQVIIFIWEFILERYWSAVQNF
jgi:hypothetical protein